jgi:hypothetical protein
VQLFFGYPVVAAPEAVRLDKGRGNFQFMGDLNRPDQEVKIQERLATGKMKTVV